jgi:hypothetical protein
VEDNGDGGYVVVRLQATGTVLAELAVASAEFGRFSMYGLV